MSTTPKGIDLFTEYASYDVNGHKGIIMGRPKFVASEIDEQEIEDMKALVDALIEKLDLG